MINVVIMDDSRIELESKLIEEKRKYIVLKPAVAPELSDAETSIEPGQLLECDCPEEYVLLSCFLPGADSLASCGFSLIPVIREIFASARYYAEKEKISTILIPASFCKAIELLKSRCSSIRGRNGGQREVEIMLRSTIREIFMQSSIKSGSVVVCRQLEDIDSNDISIFIDNFNNSQKEEQSLFVPDKNKKGKKGKKDKKGKKGKKRKK